MLYATQKEEYCTGLVDESWIWHIRMGHIKFDNLVNICNKKYVIDMPKIIKPDSTICKSCQHGNFKNI